MLLTVKELAEQLHIKPATLYAWAAQDKIPSLKIHGLLRFDRQTIHEWLRSFGVNKHNQGLLTGRLNKTSESVDDLIARAKRAAYTSRHGETRPKSSLIGKEECDGAREA
jgi:excisionase family DNA binding protein